LYIASGLVIAIIAGMVIGRFKLERYVHDQGVDCHGSYAGRRRIALPGVWDADDTPLLADSRTCLDCGSY
jgi:uncharacterized membrane protein YadS